MDTKQYIDTGILELYVCGLLDETQNSAIAILALEQHEIKNEILAIEKAIISLSSSFSPFLSVQNFEKIKVKLALKHQKQLDLQPTNYWKTYTGWAAAIAMLFGGVYGYDLQKDTQNKLVSEVAVKTQLQKNLNLIEKNNQKTLADLATIRDIKNTIVVLGGQAIAPTSFAKIYWNQETQTVFVDAAGLPKPPTGMVYQVWSLKLKPQLTPTDIGLLNNFEQNNNKIFAVHTTADADAFGITLEPAGGSVTPTMEQLYVLGKG
jgi:anti-sigma-K factor RskA